MISIRHHLQLLDKLARHYMTLHPSTPRKVITQVYVRCEAKTQEIDDILFPNLIDSVEIIVE